MSKRSKRAKRERELDKLAAAKMARLMRNEKQEHYLLNIRFEIDAAFVDRMDVVRSWARKWERSTPSARIVFGGEGFQDG